MARIGDVIDNPVTGERITFLQTSIETEGELLQFELLVQPGGFATTAHVHDHQEERFKIVSGNIHVLVDDEEQELAKGDELIIDPGTPHNWRNDSSKPARLVVEFRPALRWEILLETLFGLARDDKTNARGRPNPFQLAVIFTDFKDELRPAKTLDRFVANMFPSIDFVGRKLGYKSVYPEYSKNPVAKPIIRKAG